MIWAPHVTVAAIAERDKRFLMVEEMVDGSVVINQPAGHLEPGESLIEAVRRESLEETGWIYVGKISEDKSSWLPGSPTTITKTELPIEAGQVVTVRDDVYLRADGASNARASAPVQSVVKVGQRVEVLEVEFSHARSGGWFVWLKVVRRD